MIWASNLFSGSGRTSRPVYKSAGPISASLHPGNTAVFEELLQWWRVAGNTLLDLIGPRSEPPTPCSKDDCATNQPTGPPLENMRLIVKKFFGLVEY